MNPENFIIKTLTEKMNKFKVHLGEKTIYGSIF